MARPGFYNDNINRSYPFLKGTVGRLYVTPLPTMLELPDFVVADCGFIMGPASGFVEGEHYVRLDVVRRLGSQFRFEFVSDAPGLFDVPLDFQRDVTDPLYANEFAESAAVLEEGESDSESAYLSCREPLWSGFLITGDLARLASLLTTSGQEISGGEDEAVVEPALTQNLAGTVVSSLELVNEDRTRATAPSGCDELTWPHQTGVLFQQARCLQGPIRFSAGYNAVLLQNDLDNSLTIGAGVGAGAGEPCSEVALFDGESPPDESSNDLYSGGLYCNQVLRSFNGIGGPGFNFLAGQGVSIVPDPENNCVLIDFNLIGMTICYSDFSIVSESLSI
jgi:hypothetical protein